MVPGPSDSEPREGLLGGAFCVGSPLLVPSRGRVGSPELGGRLP